MVLHSKKIKVLIVDDSAVVRNLLSAELGKYQHIEIVATAHDPFIARDKIISLKPDVMTLDVEMPRMDGITFLEKIMESRPMPVIILSTLTPAGCDTALRALELGAIEVIQKPELNLSHKLNEMITLLVDKINVAYESRTKIKEIKPGFRTQVPKNTKAMAMIKTTDKVVAIGASTGGTSALMDIIPALPPNFPGIVLAQHMPANFTKSFANSLNKVSSLEVREAQDDDTVNPGLVLIAPGNFHMIMRRSGARYYVQVKDGPLIHHQRPAVDVLFDSVAKYAGSNALGVILTGMGKDGAAGLKKMRTAGAKTLGQDEKSSIVYGMPKVAFEVGAVEDQVALNAMASKMMGSVSV